MALIHFRFTSVSEDVDNRVIEWVKKASPVHFIVAHNAEHDKPHPQCENKHYHVTMRNPWTEGSFRTTLIRDIPEMKRKYSVTEARTGKDDKSTLERYMCHGDNVEGGAVQIMSAQAAVTDPAGMYTQDWAQDQNKRYFEYRRQFVVAKKEKAKSVMGKLLERCRERGITDVEQISDVLLDIYTEDEERNAPEHLMKAQLRGAWLTLGGKPARRNLRDSLLQGLVEPQNFISDPCTYIKDVDEVDPLEPPVKDARCQPTQVCSRDSDPSGGSCDSSGAAAPACQECSSPCSTTTHSPSSPYEAPDCRRFEDSDTDSQEEDVHREPQHRESSDVSRCQCSYCRSIEAGQGLYGASVAPCAGPNSVRHVSGFLPAGQSDEWDRQHQFTDACVGSHMLS